MVWCKSLHLLPEPETKLKFLGDMVTIPMVLMLAGFREGILLPCLFPTPWGPVFCSVLSSFDVPTACCDFPLPKQETPLHVLKQCGVLRRVWLWMGGGQSLIPPVNRVLQEALYAPGYRPDPQVPAGSHAPGWTLIFHVTGQPGSQRCAELPAPVGLNWPCGPRQL